MRLSAAFSEVTDKLAASKRDGAARGIDKLAMYTTVVLSQWQQMEACGG